MLTPAGKQCTVGQSINPISASAAIPDHLHTKTHETHLQREVEKGNKLIMSSWTGIHVYVHVCIGMCVYTCVCVCVHVLLELVNRSYEWFYAQHQMKLFTSPKVCNTFVLHAHKMPFLIYECLQVPCYFSCGLFSLSPSDSLSFSLPPSLSPPLTLPLSFSLLVVAKVLSCFDLGLLLKLCYKNGQHQAKVAHPAFSN